MKAYKATDKNMQCLNFQFELNQEFIHNDGLVMCRSGFHFCKDLRNVFFYYNFSPKNRFWEVEIPDNAEVIDYDDKSVTNKIKFIRELSLNEVKKLTNNKCYVDEDSSWTTDKRRIYYNEDGEYHREDGPAVIFASGDQLWHQNGQLHRDDGPAKIWAGDQEWYLNGRLHRVDGPAAIYTNGDQEWYQNGKRHREDGPAIIYANGGQQWWRNGLRHRIDGPAVIHANGYQAWWENEVFIK